MVALVYQRTFLFCIIVSCALQVDAQILHKHVKEQMDSVVDTNKEHAVQSDEAVTHPEEYYSTPEEFLRDATTAVVPEYCLKENMVCGFQPFVANDDGSYDTDPKEFIPYCPGGCVGYDCVRVGPPNLNQLYFRHLCKPHGWVPTTEESSMSETTTGIPASRSASIVDEL